MILGPDGERLSKRHGAVSVMQYRDDGYLPEALVNYLARLGWSHGDEEMFSREQLVEWFDLAHISRSPARFDPEKLAWLNAQHLKTGRRRAARRSWRRRFWRRTAATRAGARRSTQVVALLKERVSTLKELADAAVYFYRPLEPPDGAEEAALPRRGEAGAGRARGPVLERSSGTRAPSTTRSSR